MMLVIYGPTATGKTSLAIGLAKKFDGEIISADSRQVYKGLDIGSGKVRPGQKVVKKQGLWQVDGVKIHGFDIKKPGDRFSVSSFQKYAQKKVKEIEKKQKLPIITGGTAFYIQSLVKDFDTFNTKPNWRLRKKLGKKDVKELFGHLLKINKKKALSLNQSDKNNPRRLIRAIELSQTNTKTSPKLQIDDYLLVGLTAPNNYLYREADVWLENRFKNSMVKEVEGLIKKGVKINWLLNLGLEYRWLTNLVLKKVTFKKAKEGLQGDIHSFIRRQKTWFNKFDEMELFDVRQKNYTKNLEAKVASWLARSSKAGIYSKQ